MKLSTLVHYRNHLVQKAPKDVETLIRNHVGPSFHLVDTHTLQYEDLTRQINSNLEEITAAFDRYSSTIDQVLEKIQSDIDAIESKYFAESYRLYENDFQRDSVDYTLNRRLGLDQEQQNYLRARIRLHGDWHFAGMIIRPGKEPWIHDLLGCDPLYLIDTKPELIMPTVEQFTELYQNRLRIYSIRESDESMLHSIPSEQFGFCLVYNFFNYKPFEIIKKYLGEIFTKLKPGGTLSCTFNNCDLVGGVELVERKFMCYTPARLLFALCENIGFEVGETHQLDAACTWVELKKPGTLSSIRGGQALAKIIAKSK